MLMPLPTPLRTARPGELWLFGASVAVWNATHAADPRPIGSVYDPALHASRVSAYDPALDAGYVREPNDRYLNVQPVAGRVLEYEEQLPFGTTINDARAAAIAELPPDAALVWFSGTDYAGVADCTQAVLRSRILADLVGDSVVGSRGGYVQVAFETDTDQGYVGYDPANVNEMWLMILYGALPAPGNAGCI